jgi:tRNA threonylcarbamoyladenosine biosynthesis protein TsaB
MLVLALDTTTRAGSCALARDGVLVAERVSDSAEHASRLPADLMTLLDQASIGLREIDLFAVATGPGSFTGLRIGIATMQGLAFAGGKPLIGVPTFDALARQAGDGRVATWVDAWRGEVFAAVYEGGRRLTEPVVARPDTVLASLQGMRTLFIGDGAMTYRDLIAERMNGESALANPATPILAGAIAHLAADAAARGECPPPHAIRPLYVRRSDAELVRDARASQ